MAKKSKQKDQPYVPRLRRGTDVVTTDGPGRIVGQSMRRNDNGGPGCRQYVVKLHDGRTHHYGANNVVRSRDGQTKPSHDSGGAQDRPTGTPT